MTRLLVIRHGRTRDNALGVFQGQRGSGLDDEGRRQAERLAARLRTVGASAVVASDLERAVETARIVAEPLGLPVETRPGLREVDVGAWTGLSVAEVARRFPEEHEAWEQGRDVRRGGGETYAELAVRVETTVRAIARQHVGGTVLVVSHGAAIRALGSAVLGLPPQGSRGLAGVRNTSVSVVAWEHERLRLVSWNDVAHLDDT